MNKGFMAASLAIITVAVGAYFMCNNQKKVTVPTASKIDIRQADNEVSLKEKIENRKQYTLLTGSSGAQYFTFGTAMADAINAQSKTIEVSALTSTGVSEVLNLIQSGEADFGFITYDTGYMAATSQREYANKPPYDKLRIVMLGHTGQKTIVVYEKSGIKSIADLKGKNIASASGTSPHALDQAAFSPWDIDIDKENLVIMGYGDMATAMKDGTVDAASPHGPNPSAYILNIASAGKIRILGQTKETQAQILKAHPEWIASTIPAGTYDGVDYDVLTFANYSAVICRADIPDVDVKEFLRIIFDTDLTKLYSYGDQWGRNNKNYPQAFKNNDVFPFHHGALSFLQENILIPQNTK